MNKNKGKKVGLLNVSIITVPGTYKMTRITSLEAKSIWILAENKSSAIGHDATAEILTMIFGEKIEVNRISYQQEVGEIAIVLKMRGRIKEGTILIDIKQLEAIGYDFFLLERMA